MVQSEFFNFRYTHGDSVVKHVAKFESIVFRMKQMSVEPEEVSQIVKFMDTLPESFEALRQAWWARAEAERTYENMMDLLTSDEQHRLQWKQQDDKMVALVATTAKVKLQDSQESVTGDATSQKQKSGKKMRGPQCYRCNGYGHVKSSCTKPDKNSASGSGKPSESKKSNV